MYVALKMHIVNYKTIYEFYKQYDYNYAKK